MSKLSVKEIYRDSGLMLLAVESIEFQNSKMGKGCLVYCNLKQIAVIVCSSDGVKALDMDAKLISLEKIKQALPHLDSIITPFKKA